MKLPSTCESNISYVFFLKITHFEQNYLFHVVLLSFKKIGYFGNKTKGFFFFLSKSCQKLEGEIFKYGFSKDRIIISPIKELKKKEKSSHGNKRDMVSTSQMIEV